MSEIRRVEFPEKDLPLRQDVSLLGRLVGETLVEQHGPQLLEQVERVRKAAIGMREGEDAGAAELEKTLADLGVDEIRRIIKAFSTYLRLANLAEKVHRIRRRREYLKRGDTVQRGSLEQVLAQIAEHGAQDLAGAISNLRIRPVLTAHPTEAARRSFLEKEYSIIHRLVERLNPDRTPQEERQSLDRIRDAINSAWQTSAVPSVKPTVADELDNVLFYFTEVLYRVTPPFFESMRVAWRKATGDGMAGEPRLDQLLRFGSWVGGDMDGNPNVNADTLLDALATQRGAIIRCYRPEALRLARYLSQTYPEVAVHPELDQRLGQYANQLPEAAAGIAERHRDMPYRRMFTFIAARLDATNHDGPQAYTNAEELLADIGLVRAGLESNRGRHAGLFGVRRLIEKVRTFGFHLATLDARQDSLVHREVAAELLGRDDWMELPIADRCEVLAAEHESMRHKASGADLTATARETLAVFRAIGQARERFGQDAIGLFIISMTQGADDVLTALALARVAGLGNAHEVPLDIAPLLETVADLENGPAIMESLFKHPAYRAHLARRGDRQVVMVGYSDSNKDSGIVAARWGLQEAQRRLVEIGRRHGIGIQFFHGRGGTVSRGGGNLVKGIEGAPPDSINGYLRVTEQGEVINQKYGIRPLALRNLELMAGAVLRHGLVDTGQQASDAARQVMEQMANDARAAYRRLVFDSPEFLRYFRDATPIDVIERLQIGSRPASRRTGGGIGNLRAIPWVFSWAQVRVGLPGVYGLGLALQQAREAHGVEALRDLRRDWTFFRALLSDAEMVLAKSVLDIGQRYTLLADEDCREVFETIRREFDLARDLVLEIRQGEELLDNQRTLQRNIRLRNPYADPLHFLQIDLLRRWRAGGREDGELLRALKSTVNGIALAIQNTG